MLLPRGMYWVNKYLLEHSKILASPKGYVLGQVQAIEMYGAAHMDFFKSETNGDIKIIICTTMQCNTI